MYVPMPAPCPSAFPPWIEKAAGGGLTLDAMHEIAPRTVSTPASAPGVFVASRLALLQRGMAQVWLVHSATGLAGLGLPYGHGLQGLASIQAPAHPRRCGG